MKDYRSLEQKIRQVVREAEENRNTEARKKVANVGRPGGESKLAKQGEIKTKIIDEAGPETQPKEPKDETKDKKPVKDKDTVDAKQITGGKTEVDLEPKTDDRSEDGKKTDDKAKISTKKANREGGVQEETNMFKSDNKFGLPADLIAAVTEAMKKCPKCGMNPCQCDGDVKEELKGGQKKLDKNHNGKLDKQDFKMLRKEEVVSEGNPANKEKKNAAVAAVGAKNKDDHYLDRMNPAVADKIRGREKMSGVDRKQYKEEVEQIDEVNHREYGAKGKMHPTMAKSMKVGQHADFYGHGTGDKHYGMVTKNSGTAVHVKAGGKTHKFSVASNIGEETDPGFSAEELARIEAIAETKGMSRREAGAHWDTNKNAEKKSDTMADYKNKTAYQKAALDAKKKIGSK
jgi:hypothetical protein